MIHEMIPTKDFRRAMGAFATGVTVITTGRGKHVHAMTANAVTSVSLDPPLLLFCVNKSATMSLKIRQHQQFVVNILAEQQADLSNYFAGAARTKPPQFAFQDWSTGARLCGAPVSISCYLDTLHDGGDHWILVGRVVDIYQDFEEKPPLIFYKGRYLQSSR